MNILVLVLMLLAAHYSATALVPAAASKAAVYWPFAANSAPVVGVFGPYPNPATQLLSVIAAASFLAGVLAFQGWLLPTEWWMPLVLVGIAGSTCLYALYLGPFALVPLAINIVLLWGIFAQHWTVSSLHGT